ncbi:peptidylprolyl isomerase [Paenibacillus mendelii]|uniref:Peptidyl-prolyl cis-trans isomerase n=1 Tax=Paenibacillus mendelii TaxID=206163 RepID=A0ABV6J4P0_9BACL|nr:peptidylprolyl isomerase [Paenibacillus mendelii]MCQ6560458.1 peptidylprolyl isomerase [Paenibacillus mendelii]
MSDKLKGLVLGLLIGILICSPVIYASGTQIEVVFKKLHYIFDGEEKVPPAGGGGFVYNNTTYVPLRFVGESLGKPVYYDSETSTVRIGKQYKEMPKVTLDPKQMYYAVVETSKGKFTIELFAKDAPVTVGNFVALSKDGYYNDLLFHRILQDFVIQTGDPTATGSGGPGYSFKDELNNGHSYEEGIVAMANAGPNTNGSQFFICTGSSCANLNNYPNYSIFGKVVEGMDVVRAISKVPVVANPATGEVSKPKEAMKLLKVSIKTKPLQP